MFNRIIDFLFFFVEISGFEKIIQKIPSKIIRILFTIFMYPVIFIIACFRLIYGRILWHNDHNQLKNFDDDLSIVAIAKNEAEYLKEWIDYHSLLGITKFYIYDNESTDNTKEVLTPYINEGVVFYQFILGKGKQHDAYNDAIQKFSEKTRYMAFLDCDEFLLPLKSDDENLPSLVCELLKNKKNVGGLGINWNVFGSSGHEVKPKGLIIDNYLYRTKNDGNFNDRIKSIVNPRLVKKMLTHYPEYYSGIYTISEKGNPIFGPLNRDFALNTIRINHYFTKSKEEWIQRRSLGKADFTNDEKRSVEQFYENDKRDIYDTTILKFSEKLKNK